MLNLRDSSDMTPLHCAAKFDHALLVEYLAKQVSLLAGTGMGRRGTMRDDMGRRGTTGDYVCGLARDGCYPARCLPSA